MNQILEINDNDFEKKIINKSIKNPILLKFWGNWCQPCKKMEPVLENILSCYKGKIDICSINVGENSATASKFNVRSIPTLLFFFEKKLVYKHSGLLTEIEIKDLMKIHFNI